MSTSDGRTAADDIDTAEAVSIVASDVTKESEFGVDAGETAAVSVVASDDTIPAVHSYEIKPALIAKYFWRRPITIPVLYTILILCC